MIESLSKLFARVGGALILLSAVLITIDVVTRGIVGSSLVNSFEFSTYALAVAVSFSLAYALVSRAHIRIDILLKLLPLRPRLALDIVALTVFAVFVGLLVWYAGETFRQSLDFGARSNSSLAIPLAIPQGVWLLGLVFFLLVCVMLLSRSVVNLMRGRLDDVARAIGQRDELQG